MLSSALVRSSVHRIGDTWEYGRMANPTVDAVARRLAELEHAPAATLLGSGTAAIVCALLSTTPPGCQIVAAREICADAHRVLTTVMPQLGRSVTFVAVTDLDGWADALALPAAVTAYVESVSNPTLRVAEIDLLAACATAHGARLVVDATAATPVCQRPLTLGAHLVVHSASKYLNGHSDVIAGVVCGCPASIDGVREAQIGLGAQLDPAAASLLERGLKTLDVRMARHDESAQAVAGMLAGDSQVEWVRRPRHRLLSAGTGLIALKPRAGINPELMLVGLQLVRAAPTFGGTESLAYAPHADARADRDWLAHVDDGLIRVSVGLEPSAEIAADLIQALETAGAEVAAR